MNAARIANFPRHDVGQPTSGIQSRSQHSPDSSGEIAKRIDIYLVYSQPGSHEIFQGKVSISDDACALQFDCHGATMRIELAHLNAGNFHKELLLGHEVRIVAEDDYGKKFPVTTTLYGTAKQANIKLSQLMHDFLRQSR